MIMFHNSFKNRQRKGGGSSLIAYWFTVSVREPMGADWTACNSLLAYTILHLPAHSLPCLLPATYCSCLAHSLTLKMEEICSSEIPVDFHQSTRHYIPEHKTQQSLFFVLFTILHETMLRFKIK
jgi:hypothetical protein